ncbi:hypothetical protein TNCV_3312571 [Trichonephila clavipes]|nr:hypothetical protein TNCV_3312571 [Trichonephila clavipes]
MNDVILNHRQLTIVTPLQTSTPCQWRASTYLTYISPSTWWLNEKRHSDHNSKDMVGVDIPSLLFTSLDVFIGVGSHTDLSIGYLGRAPWDPGPG